VTASGGTLVLGGSLTGNGALTVAAGAVLQLLGGYLFTGGITGAGSVMNADDVSGSTNGVSLAGTGTLDITNFAGDDITGDSGDGVILAAAPTSLNNTG